MDLGITFLITCMLPRCDRVLLLKDGSMADIGTFEELQTRVDFHGFIDNRLSDNEETETELREGQKANEKKRKSEEGRRKSGAKEEELDVAKLTRTGSTIGKSQIVSFVLSNGCNIDFLAVPRPVFIIVCLNGFSVT